MVVAAAALAGCGEKRETLGPGRPERLELALDRAAGAGHAGVYSAEAAGRFREVGIDLDIREPADPAAPLRQVAAGRADLAISAQPEVLRARDRGLDVVAVGALVREPLTSIISLPRGRIRRLADLRGKTVGTGGGGYQSALLRAVLAHAGVRRARVTERDVGFALNRRLLAGSVDATLGGFYTEEGVELRLRRRRPRIIRIQEAGVPPYDELVLVASGAALERRGDELRRFIGALAQGTRDLERRPERAIRRLRRANREVDARVRRASVAATLPLLRPPGRRSYGYQDPRKWRRLGGWMHRNRLLRRAPEVDAAFTNDYLPGAGI